MRDSSGNRLRTVWVLGAGSSRALGGPLLPDLLRMEAMEDLQARYPAVRYGDLAQCCSLTQQLFRAGLDSEWKHAEAFLEILDSASQDDALRAKVLRMSADRGPGAPPIVSREAKDRLDELQRAATRSIAAECSAFVTHARGHHERWAPYRAWLRSLDPDYDTLVSFNYDHVLETAASSPLVRDILPGSDSTGRSKQWVRLLKLHGSVTWVRDLDTCSRAQVSEVLARESGWPALGTPGRSKRKLLEDLFAPLWTAAERALGEAEVVVFVGYRFPESDSDARHRLLSALSANTVHRLRALVVLGPHVNAPEAIRVRRLLEACSRRSRRVLLKPLTKVDPTDTHLLAEILAEPLFAEDFFSLYADDGPLSRLP